MWGPKCKKVRKPRVLRVKRWSLSISYYVCLTKSGFINKYAGGDEFTGGRRWVTSKYVIEQDDSNDDEE